MYLIARILKYVLFLVAAHVTKFLFDWNDYYLIKNFEY